MPGRCPAIHGRARYKSAGWSGVRSRAAPSVNTARSAWAARFETSSFTVSRPLRVRLADCDLTLDLVGIQPREHLELLELVAATTERGVQIRQLFARGDESRRQGDRLLQSALCVGGPPRGAKAQRLEVIAVGHLFIDAKRGFEGRQCGVGSSFPIAGQRQLVVHARGAVVQSQRLLVDLAGTMKSLLEIADVGELLERAGGHGVQNHGRLKIASRGLEVGAPLVRLTPAKVRQHRVGPQRNCAAVGLDGGKRLIVAQGRVAPAEKGAVIPVARRGLIGEGGAGDREGQQDDNSQIPLHGSYRNAGSRNF